MFNQICWRHRTCYFCIDCQVSSPNLPSLPLPFQQATSPNVRTDKGTGVEVSVRLIQGACREVHQHVPSQLATPASLLTHTRLPWLPGAWGQMKTLSRSQQELVHDSIPTCYILGWLDRFLTQIRISKLRGRFSRRGRGIETRFFE